MDFILRNFLWRLGAVFILTVPVSGQQAQPPSVTSPQSTVPPRPSTELIPRSAGERVRRQEANRHVILNVLVTDTLGKPVAGLKQDDFTLLDNHRQTEIGSLHFVEGRAAATPVHVMLVLDSVNNSSRSLGYERKEIEKFLGRDGGRLDYPVSIVSLTDSGAHVGEASRDGSALIAELKRLSTQVHTRSAGADESGDVIQGVGRSIYATVEGPGRVKDLNQRFKLSVTALFRTAVDQEDVSGRALMIWVGPGWPPLTGPDFLPATPDVHENYFGNIVDLNTALREAQVTLDDVSTSGLSREAGIHNGDDGPFFPAVTSASRAETGNLALPVLVNQSGGRVLDTRRDLADEIAACIADADGYYVLSFTAPIAASVDEYHALEIRVNRSGLMVRTNAGYYAQP